MYMKLKDGKRKVLTFSYDDGVVQDIRLVNIFNKYGLKATFNINSGCYLPEDVTREKFRGRLKRSEGRGRLYFRKGVCKKTIDNRFFEDVTKTRRNEVSPLAI